MLNSGLQVSGLGFTCDGARDSFVYHEAWQRNKKKYFTTLLNRYKQQLYESCHDIVMTHFTFMVLWYIL